VCVCISVLGSTFGALYIYIEGLLLCLRENNSKFYFPAVKYTDIEKVRIVYVGLALVLIPFFWASNTHAKCFGQER
jgi:hypothetical protein